MNDLINSIANGVWMIQSDYVQANIPLITRILQGKNFVFERGMHDQAKLEANLVYNVPNSNLQYLNVHSNTNFDQLPVGTIAVIPLNGVLLKKDQECGPIGMESRKRMIENAVSSKNVSAIVLRVESPGGQANFLDTFAKTVFNANKVKPVLTSHSSVNGSAAFYASVASEEIYASEQNDVVGSVGTLISLQDLTGLLKKNGVKIHEIYAEQSTLKNDNFKEALKGNYKPIQERLLNPIAQQFIDAVKSYRPQITNEDVFKGQTYMSDEAIKLGIIDGIKTFEEVIQRAKFLADERNSSNNLDNHTTNSMKFPVLNSLLNVDELVIDAADSTSTLQVSQLETIEASLVELANLKAASKDAEAVVASANDVMKETNGLIASLGKTIAKIKSENTDLKAEVKALGGKAEEETVVDTKKDKVETVIDEDQQILDKVNAKIEADLPAYLK